MGSIIVEWNNAADSINSGLRNAVRIESKSWEGRTTRVVHPTHGTISGIDPTVSGVEKILISMGIKQHANKKGRICMYVGQCELMVVFGKRGGKFHINGMVANVGVLTKALARTVIRSLVLDDTEESLDVLEEYLYRCIDTPEHIMYVLENKLPYSFYEMELKVKSVNTQEHMRTFGSWNFTKHECRLEVKQIDFESYAVELYSGVWGEINGKQLSMFVKTYWQGQKRGKWLAISPTELYYRLMGVNPTESQNKLMVEFLKQNRKEDIIERRAMQLVDDLSKNYDRINKTEYNGNVAMLVRGKIADWMVVAGSTNGSRQDVQTYILQKGGESGGGESNCHLKCRPKKAVWGGPICIDNNQSGASVGDQMTARAFALLNDSVTANLIHTLSNHMGKLREGQKTVRLNWDAL